mgnify:CR=1 FL=1
MTPLRNLKGVIFLSFSSILTYMESLLFIHYVIPMPIALTIGPLSIYWYGIIIAIAALSILFVSLHNSRYFNISKEVISDSATWIIVGGILGARIYEVLLNASYYVEHPSEILAIWNGGLAIHGALFGGFIALLWYTHRKKINTWSLLAVFLSAVPLGQAIGRWGNWFNQELIGSPTLLPWGIPIDILHRPTGFENVIYFHPTFLYECIGSIVIFLILQLLVRRRPRAHILIASYLILYGLLRFSLEFIKIDLTPEFIGLRWPQIISLLFILTGVSILIFFKAKTKLSEASHTS